jgi:cyanophycinase
MSPPAFALLGSGEFEPWTEPVDRWIQEASGRSGPVLILPTASAPEGDRVFDRWAQMGLDHHERVGIPAEVAPLKTRADATSGNVVDRLRTASVAYFSGGNPAYLAETLAGTPFWTVLLTEMDRGLAYVGCSAGVAALGEIAPDVAQRRFTEGMWQPGLRLFTKVAFGPHWDALDRHVPGLRSFFLQSVPDDCLLVGIDERTAMVGDGVEWTVVGMGGVEVHQRSEKRSWTAGDSFSLPLLGGAGQLPLRAPLISAPRNSANDEVPR